MSSKWCCMLAAVCLSVILLSLDADAQPTVDDDSSQCDSASLQELANTVSVIASDQQELEDEMKNETRHVLDVLENVVNAIKIIASNQRKTAEDVKRLLESNQSRACECVNSTCPSPAAAPVINSTDCITMSTTVSPPESSSKQALVSALVCEYQRLLSVKNEKLSYRRGTARCVVSVEILPIAAQQCRNCLYDKS